MCSKAYQKLLGVGDSTLTKLKNGEPAYTMHDRTEIPRHPVLGFALDRGRLWQKVLMFLWIIYMSQAEVLPTTFNAACETPFSKIDKDEDFGLRTVNQYLNSLNTCQFNVDLLNMGPGTFNGPKRQAPS